MSYREKGNIIRIAGGLIIRLVFALIIYQMHLHGKFDLTQDFQMWGKLLLILTGISMVARIVIAIIFYFINAIVTHETEISAEDERDKIIKIKATRNSNYVFGFCFLIIFVLIAMGMPVYGMFAAFIIMGFISETVFNCSQLYYQRKRIIIEDGIMHNNIGKFRYHHEEMTQQELADEVSVSRQTIAAIEEGKYQPTLELAFKIASVFEIPLHEVFSYTPGEE